MENSREEGDKNIRDKFKGLFAPAFTIFRNDEKMSLDTAHIDKYAAFLKSEKVKGVVINGILGEGPSMNVRERKRNAEAWFDAAYKYELVLIVQIGGASVADVIALAEHAEKLRVDGVLLIPDPLYKPTNIKCLVNYCKLISSHCKTRPFFYLHNYQITEFNLDVIAFAKEMSLAIPTFIGIQYVSDDMSIAAKCLEKGIFLILGFEVLLLNALVMGFESATVVLMSIKPDMCSDIYNAVMTSDLALARAKQKQVNALVYQKINEWDVLSFIFHSKTWFNEEMLHERKLGFSAGPTRRMI